MESKQKCKRDTDKKSKGTKDTKIKEDNKNEKFVEPMFEIKTEYYK